MTDFLARDMDIEALLINPTMTHDKSMESFARISIMDTTIPRVRSDDFPLNGTHDDESPSKITTIQDLFNHRFSSSYSSEEETASPHASSDDLSIHSTSEHVIIEMPVADRTPILDPNITVEDLFLKPEQMAQSCVKIEHRCNRAQAVSLTAVGRPKVISMAKVVVTPSPSRAKRSSAESIRSSLSPFRSNSRRSIRPSHEGIIRVSRVLEEDAASSDASTDALSRPTDPTTAATTAQTTPVREESPSRAARKPSVPLMRAAAAFDPFPKLDDVANGNVLSTRPRTLTKRAHTTTATSPEPAISQHASPLEQESLTRRRLHRFASSFSLSNASDLIRRKGSISTLRRSFADIATDSTPRSSLANERHVRSNSNIVYLTPIIPRRQSSMGKLTPRGPTERAPIIVLPPCPDADEEAAEDDDDDDDDDFLSVSPVEALQAWDRERARHVAKASKSRPSIDDIVARMM